MSAATALEGVQSMLATALKLRDDADPLMAGQIEGVVGRLTALLAVMGETPPAAATAPAPMPSMRLDGQIAVVTGGSGGLGTLGANAFAQAGADVIVVARSLDKCEQTAEQVRALGRRALALSVDVTSEEQVQAMVARVQKDWGRIDILFNNAGITSPKTMLDSSTEEWLKVVDTNIHGTFLCSHATAPVMVRQGSGRIINMCSILARSGMANRTAYCTSKAGIAALTRSLAFELGPKGITVNAIGPNVIVTDLNRELIKTQPQLYGDLLKRIPLGRLGQPEDIAGALVFLASPAASFITGHLLFVDGGYEAG